MGFFKDMGFFEKVAFVVSLPVLVPAAVVATTYEMLTEDDAEPSSEQIEREARERIEREAKENIARLEREAIVSYAKSGLITLWSTHVTVIKPPKVSLNLTKLRRAIESDQSPTEILHQLVPEAVEIETSLPVRLEIKSLNKELDELRLLRQVIANLQPRKADA
jgi:SOS-response transcriptional repressor LexA